MHPLQPFGCDGVSGAPLLAGAAQHLMQDRALHRLGALSGRQSCAIAKPVLPRTIPIGLDRAVRKNKVALINLGATIDLPAGGEGQGGEKRTCDRPFQHSPRHTELCEKPGLSPPPPPLVVVGAGEVQTLARSRHGYVQQPPLLRDHVLSPAHERLEHRGRQLESLRPS